MTPWEHQPLQDGHQSSHQLVQKQVENQIWAREQHNFRQLTRARKDSQLQEKNYKNTADDIYTISDHSDQFQNQA